MAITEECAICKRIKEGQKNVYEDSELVAFLDDSPANPGHLLLAPKEHFTGLTVMPKELSGKLMSKMVDLMKAIERGLEPNGTSIVISEGEGAEQSIPHCYIHIIPRFPGDQKFIDLEWKAQEFDEERMDKILKTIKKNI